MAHQKDNYLSKLLAASSSIANPEELIRFLEGVDLDHVEKQILADEKAASLSANKDLYPTYLMYEQHWFKYLATIINTILSDETNLSRVLTRVHDELMYNRSKKKTKACFFGKLNKYPSEIIKPWKDAIALKFLKENCDPDVDCVIETGAGTAINLFRFWLGNGPLSADYYGLEITQTSRLCANIMSCLEPRLKLKSMFFDYQKPDFSTFYNKYNNAFIFTKGSIEQIATLPDVYFENLLKISDRLTCVHFEPVGWQMVPPHKHDKLSKKHKQRCKDMGYNENLWELLKSFESRKLIKINGYELNFSGKKDHFETYISWTKL